MASIICPGCQTTIEIPEHLGAPFIKCSACGKSARVPSLPGRPATLPKQSARPETAGSRTPPISNKVAPPSGRSHVVGGRPSDGSDVPPELELSHIARVWQTAGAEKALDLARQRLLRTPDNFALCGMLSQMHAGRMQVKPALASIVRAFHLAPDNAIVVHHLALIFQLGYFAEQVDLCLTYLRTLPEYQADPAAFGLPVELFLKCDADATTVSIDGHEVGTCPVRLGQTAAGPHKIVWTLVSGRTKRFSVTLEGGTVAKFRFHPDRDEVSDEISRDGAIMVFTANGSRDLREEVGAYLVDDLAKLPHPSVDDCLGA